MNIGIVGLGLIGGSLGLDLRSQGHRVLGVSRQAETCARAVVRGAADEADTDLALMAKADVIFLCTPLHVIKTAISQLVPHLRSETIVTDVGSVKTWVVETITPYWPNFVGGHPMAGTAESGIEAALPNLFLNAPYVLTPIEATPALAVETVTDIVRPLGVRLYHCRPEDHDRAVAWISHLPVMVSSSLIAACLQEPDTAVQELARQLASSGFRDTSRVGGGNPELGLMMARYNQKALLQSLSTYREQIDRVIGLVQQEHWADLVTQLEQTQAARSAFVK